MSGKRYSGLPPWHERADGGVCTSCYNLQERYSYPFRVYCPHRGYLVEVTGRRNYTSWPLPVDELLELVRLRER